MLSLVLLTSPALNPVTLARQEAAPVPANAAARQHRARLQDLQRDAAALLKQAAERDRSAEQRQRLLLDASRRFESLASENGGPGAAGPGTVPVFPADLREDLRRAAAELREPSSSRGAARSAVSIDRYVALLDRAAARLEASAGAGLEFQGSYSQATVAEPAYGGHASSMGPPPIDAARPASDTSSSSPVQFEERRVIPVKTFCGGRTKDHILESGGSGIALFDYDGDGRLDVYLVTAMELTDARERIPHRNALLRNLGDWKFQDVSAAAGVDVAAWGNGVCAADYDDDGDLDLHVTNYGPNVLFRNNGDGTFTDVAAGAGVQAPGWSTGCAFFDADADGDLDLYVARYVQATWDDVVKAQRTLVWRGGPRVMVGPKGLPGEADLFFENRGDGTFVDATDRRGLTDTARAYGFGVLTTDYDADGHVDLFVANDTNPNFLYRNRGDGGFESVGLLSGVALNAEGRAQAGMGVDAGDYDGDGRLDLVVTNFAHDTNTLYRNLDGTQFEDVTSATGLAAPTFVRMGWGTAFLDADLDGDLDLFFANGHIYPHIDEHPHLQETFHQKSQLLLNDGGKFRDVSERSGGGLQLRKAGRGLAVGDLDGDGDLDLVISNMDDGPSVLENRQKTERHWVAFRLVRPGRNRFGIGARVTVRAGGRQQVREVRSGGSYLSQNDLRAHFGLGAYSGPVDVDVRLPGGLRWSWKGLPADRVNTLTLDDTRP